MSARQPARLVTRREFVETAAIAGTGLLIGFSLPAGRAAPAASNAELNAWIHIGSDDVITILTSEYEMGQGVLTSIPQILAEELDADWTKVRSRHAPTDSRKYGMQGTFGSTSIRQGYNNLRKAGAAAREMLLRAAAETWSVDPASCQTENGTVVHTASGRRLTYGQLAERAARVPPPENPRLKDPRDFRIVGKSLKRLDVTPKVTGAAVFGTDVRVPGMLTAQVVHPPYFGGRVKSFDATRALAVPGVRHVVEIPTGVAVIADDFWSAKQGRDALSVTWDPGPHADLSSEKITSLLRDLVKKPGMVARSEGDVAQAIEGAARRIEATYEVPYLAHACMEPLNCTADVRADRCEVWAATQSPTGTQQAAARITGLAPERVTVHALLMGGGFGRRTQTDFVADAVHASKAIGRPVKVIWTREDDMAAGYYRPVGYNQLTAALDAAGRPVAWRHLIASAPLRVGQNGMDATAIEGAANLPYAIPNVYVSWARADLPVPTHFWRSVGNSQNGFITESFIDEVAHAAGKDPVAFRLALLAGHPRHARALKLAAEKAGWGTPPPAGRARGAAVLEAFGSITAEVAEVSVSGGAVRVHKVVCAVDCGVVINPDIVAAQIESAVAFGLSAALYGEITLEAGRVRQKNFDDYPILRMDEMPAVETHIIAEGDPVGGIGEAGTPTIAPALCNAIFALTGKRIRKLPIGRLT
ncbi:MAG TPA: xanthine dehydrogenase family protein molybdopterin-binding subunit [Gemmatimonadales bacterium]|nr:xanthine dehydrogenase family protein molybdopterin-binding subunit [Gemmatimonadales bacterium]